MISARTVRLVCVFTTYLATLLSSAEAASRPDYAPGIARLNDLVRDEMSAWGITGVAVALVDDQDLVYAAGFGQARRESVFRCGSISKLFTALAVMQCVEQGKVGLDTPLHEFGLDFLPVNPFTNAPTLRQLLCHRSGMIRESPIGGYLDPSEPGMGRTLQSLSPAVLVNPPNLRTRYSNVGPTIAGRVVEIASGQDFDAYQRRQILGPIGMTNSCWFRKQGPVGNLVPAFMRVADGKGGYRREKAPLFDLGTVPAGNLFTGVEDLGRFISMLAAVGETPRGRIIKRETLQEMFTPQLTTESTGFGLGFMVGKFRNHKMVSHNGAVYGYSSSLLFLPGSKLGVVVLGNEDIVNARIQRIALEALSVMVGAKLGEKPPAPPVLMKLPEAELRACAGKYRSQSFWAMVSPAGGALKAEISGQPASLKPTGPLRFVADSRMHNGVEAIFERDLSGKVTGFNLGTQRFERVPENNPRIPKAWEGYVGVYGPRFIPLVVTARDGELYVTTENMVDYRLTPVNRHVFAFPEGMYADEYLVFLPGKRGIAGSIDMANMVLWRR